MSGTTSGSRATQADILAVARDCDDYSEAEQASLRVLRVKAVELRENWQSAGSGRVFDDLMERWNRNAALMAQAMGRISGLLRRAAGNVDETATATHQEISTVEIQTYNLNA